jgi:hypothetical protein
MLASAFAYLLTFILAFTLVLLTAFLLRIVLILIASRIYAAVSGNKDPQKLIMTSIKFVQPAGFLSSIFHGYFALALGVVVLRGFEVHIDWFLGAFLTTSFVLFGLRNIQKPPKVNLNENSNLHQVNSDTTLIIDPEVQQANPMDNMQEELKNQLKGRMQEFMQGNTIVGLIGKVTGVVLATFNYIPL